MGASLSSLSGSFLGSTGMSFWLGLSWGTQACLSVWVFLGEHRHAFLSGSFLENTGTPFCLGLSWETHLSVWVFLGKYKHTFLFGFFLGNTGMPFCLGFSWGTQARLSVLGHFLENMRTFLSGLSWETQACLSVWVFLGKHRHTFPSGSFLGNIACLSVWGHFLENTDTPFCKCLSWETQACLSICGEFPGEKKHRSDQVFPVTVKVVHERGKCTKNSARKANTNATHFKTAHSPGKHCEYFICLLFNCSTLLTVQSSLLQPFLFGLTLSSFLAHHCTSG